MNAMPTGKVRPPITAPSIAKHAENRRQANIVITELTSYQFRDDSAWTIREFDYRLKWVLEPRNDGIDPAAPGRFKGSAKATLYVWNRPASEWREVWSFWRDSVESPYSEDKRAKTRSWARVLAELAEQATTILL